MTGSRDVLSITLFFSALAHVVLILGVTFSLPEIAATPTIDNNLEIVLINAANQEVDEQATNVSTQNNLGGGASAQEAESPAPMQLTQASPFDSVMMRAKNERMNQANDQLITQRSQTPSINQHRSDTTQERAVPFEGEDVLTTDANRQQERERLIAKITQRQIEYQKIPRKAFLSPSTKVDGAAQYLFDWRNTVQKVGNENLPSEIKQQRMVGSVLLSIMINRNGTINKIVVNQKSSHPLINQYAQQLLRKSAPFNPFPDGEFFNEKDVIVITRWFEFDSESGFSHRGT